METLLLSPNSGNAGLEIPDRETNKRRDEGRKQHVYAKFITPALRRAGWDEMAQIREQVSFTKGRIIVRG